jgi:hypothetical protein
MLTTLYRVKTNHESPLLRLPPEIRNRIWRYTLGGKVFRQCYGTNRRCVLRPEPRERGNIFALLTACRQIYAETSVLPFVVNTFSIQQSWGLRSDTKRFRKGQRSQIDELSLDVMTSDFGQNYGQYLKTVIDVATLAAFPELKRLKFCLFPHQDWRYMCFAECETRIRSLYEYGLSAQGIDMLVEKMDVDFDELVERYNYLTYVLAFTLGS